MTQANLFDVAESERRKDAGMAMAVAAHASWLEEARDLAVRFAEVHGTVCADDLYAAGLEIPEGSSPNVMGSVFRDDRLEFAGYTKSQRPVAHRNLLRLWRLKP